MSLNSTPSSERVHIGFFGRRNAGKSSVVNRVTGQELSVVSDVKGTTTDPVMKAMELLPMGPVQIIDTPGIDDEGSLGELRVRKTRQILNRTDVAVLVVDITADITEAERELIDIFTEKEIPYLIALNKADLLAEDGCSADAAAKAAASFSGCRIPPEADRFVSVSAVFNTGITQLKERIARLSVSEGPERRIVGDLLNPGDLAILVVPIDSAAPKGRLILPQQQTIRDVLEAGASAVVVRETELSDTLEALGKKPRIVITDSQVFGRVSAETPSDIDLTSFSILMARYKGTLLPAVSGAAAIETLKDGDRVLISEGCTHHRQCDDIGSVKLPRWLREYTGKKIEIELSSGREFPEDLSPYRLILHCGGCMLNEREMRYRQKCADDQNVPMTNYGIAIAYMQGILRRTTAMLPDAAALLPDRPGGGN